MNLCRCCKTSHRGLRFMHSQPGNADDVKNKLSCEVLAALGDTSLSWFDDLTAAHIDAQATRKDAERQVQDESEFWSPCPRGGVFSVAVPNKNRNGDMTPMTALLSTSGNTSNILLNASPSMQSPMNGLKCDQSAISWTSAMATPLDPSSAFASFSESKDENFAFGEMDEGNITITEQSATEAGKLKPFSRQLFSPGQTSLNDDSLSEMFNADAATSDMTVELESTLMSEGELPCTADNTLTSNPESAEKVNEDGRKMKKSWPHGSGSVVTVGDHTENRQGVKLACLKEPSHSNGDLKGSRFPAHELSSESGKKGSSIRDDAGRGSREKGLTVLDNSDVGGDCSIAVSDRSGLSEENFQDFQTPHEVENERVKDKDRSVEDERRSSHIDELLSMVFCSQESSPAEAGTKDGGQVTQMHVEENTKCEVSGVGERCSGNKDRRAEVQALNLPRDSLGVNTLFDGTRKNSDLGDVDQTTPVRKVGLGNVQSFVGESCDPGKGCSNLEHSLVPMTDLGRRLSNGLDEGSKTPQSILKNPKTPKLSTRKKVRFSTEDMGPGDVENTAGGNLSTVEGLDMTVTDSKDLKELSNSKSEFLVGEQLPPSEMTEDAPELNELGDAVLADLSLSMFEADDGGEHESVWEEEEPLLSSQVEGLADRVSGLYEEGDAEMSHEEVDDAESGLAAVGCETDGFGPDDSFEVLASSFCSQVLLSSQVDDRADRHRAVQEEVRDPCLAEKVLRVDVPHWKNSSESFFKEDDLVKCSESFEKNDAEEMKSGTEDKQATVLVSENKKAGTAGTMNGFRTLDCDFEEDDESLCLAVALAENQQIYDKEKASPDVDGNSVCVDGGSSDEDKGGLVKGVVDSKSGVRSHTIDEQKTKECSRTVGCTEDQNCLLSKTSMATVATSTSGPVTTVLCASRGEHTLTASSSSSLSAASRVSPAVTAESLQTPQSARPLLSSATSSSSSLSTMSRVSPTVTVQSLKTLQSSRPLLSSAASSSSSSSSVVTPSSSRPSPSLAKPLLSLLTSKRKKFVYPTQRAEEETPEMRLSKLLNAALSSKLPSLQATVPHTGKVNSNIMHSPKLSETPTSSKAVRLQCVAEQPSVRQAAITPAYHSAVNCQQKAVSPKNPPRQPAMSKKGQKDLLGFARFSDVFCDEAVEEKPPETTTKGAANVLWAQEMSEGRKDNAVRSVERRDLNVGTVESVTMPEAERTSAGELTVRLCDKVVTCKLGNNNSNYRSDSSDTQNAVDKRSNHHHADAAAARVEDFIETARGTGDSPTTTPEDADEFMFSSQMWRATEFSQIESSQTHAEDGSTKVMASDSDCMLTAAAHMSEDSLQGEEDTTMSDTHSVENCIGSDGHRNVTASADQRSTGKSEKSFPRAATSGFCRPTYQTGTAASDAKKKPISARTRAQGVGFCTAAGSALPGTSTALASLSPATEHDDLEKQLENIFSMKKSAPAVANGFKKSVQLGEKASTASVSKLEEFDKFLTLSEIDAQTSDLSGICETEGNLKSLENVFRTEKLSAQSDWTGKSRPRETENQEQNEMNQSDFTINDKDKNSPASPLMKCFTTASLSECTNGRLSSDKDAKSSDASCKRGIGDSGDATFDGSPQRVSAGTVDGEATHSVFSKPSGFTTGRGAPISRTEESTEMAQQVMMECQEDRDPDACDGHVGNATYSENRTFSSGQCGNGKDDRLPKAPSAGSVAGNCADTFGFQTAGGRAISLSATAQQKARLMWESVRNETDCGEQADKIPPKVPPKEIVPGSTRLAEKPPLSSTVKPPGGTKPVNNVCENTKSNASKPKFDKSYKGFRPFKPPKLKQKTVATSRDQTGRVLNQSCGTKQTNNSARVAALEQILKQCDDVMDTNNDASGSRSAGESKEEIRPFTGLQQCSNPGPQASPLPSLSTGAEKSGETIAHQETSKSNFTLGFRKAGGADVTVSRQALRKAEMSHSEDGGDLSSRDTASMSVALNTSGEPQADATLKEPPMVGFMTASRKNVEVSDKAMSRAKSVWIEVQQAEREVSTARPMSGFVTAAGKEVKVSEEGMTRAKSLWTEDQNNAPESDEVLRDASGLSLPTCGSGLGHDSALTGFTKSGEVHSLQVSKAVLPSFTTAGGNDIQVSAEVVTHSESLWTDGQLGEPEISKGKQSMAGFITAAGKGVQVSAQALSRAEDKDMSGTTRGQTGEALKDGAVPGFMTAAGKSVGVSEKAFRHAKSLWSDGMQGEEEGSKGKPVSGFMTAAGKNVQASEDAMAHAKSWWNDGQSEMLQAASDRSSPVKGSEPEPKDTFSDVTEYSKHEAEAPNSKPMSGFTTAAGRQVRVSDDAMAQAKSLWTNDQRAQSGGECGEMLQGEANFSGPVSGLRSASSKGVFAGFTTAGGAAVKVSEKGLQHARSLWHEEGASFEHEGTAVGEQRTESLKQPTAHTNDGQVTQKKNEKLTGTSKKNDSKTSYTSPAVSPSGFQTAGGANVPVSDKSMKDAEKLWLAEQSDHDLADVEEAALSGQLCDLLDGSDADRTGMNRAAPNARAGEPAGFSTGKGRSVVLSKSALRAAQSLLSCEQEDVGPGSLLAVPPDDRLQDDRSDCSTDSTDRRIGKKLLAPQRPKNEEFHCDRRGFKRRRLQPILTGESPEASERDPLASKLESGHVDAVKGKTTSTFKPPYKSTAHTLSSTSTLARPHPQSPRTSGSSSGFIAPRSRQSRPVDSSDTSTSSKSYIFFSKRGRGGGGRRGEITDAGQTNSATAAADTENSASERNSEIPNGSVAPSVVDESLFDMNDEEENRLLCREMDNLSEVMEQPAESNPAVALSCWPPSSPKLENAKLQSDDSKKSEEREGRAKSVVHQPSSVRGSNNATNEEATAGCATISAGVKTQSARAMLPADVLDEARMRQDKLCRVKLRKKIQPRKGRWLEERSKNGGSRSYQESGLAPLWDLSRKELLHLGVSESTLGVSSCSAALFRLDLRRHYPGLGGSVLLGDGALLVPDAHGFAGWEEFHSALLTLDSVDPKLMDKSWTENHYRWIVWKLAASEVSFPHHLAGRSLSPENVMYQLKYRYDREVDLCQRSALRKILERDDAAGKRMVLCVSSVKKESNGQLSVEVTDGWYCLRAQVDGVLNDLLTRGRLQAGDKIVTSGAEIVGAQDACSPLEVKEGTALKLSGNSTRPAPWCAKLGFCSTPAALCVPLSSLSPHGDTVGCVDVVLTRKYPVMYMEKLGDGSHMFRSEEEEGRALRAFEERRQEQAEKVMAKLQAEMDAEDAADRVRGRRHRRVTRKEVEDLWSGQDIAEAVERALNPEEVQQSLSASQLSRLEEYTRSQMERKQQEMNRKLQDAMAEKAVDTRHVTPVQKFRVAGCCSRDIDAKARCLVTVWRPGAEWSEMCEGGRYRLFHLAASASRGANKQCRVSLTASRQTRVQPRPISENLCDLIYEPREAWLVKDLERTQPMGGEFDFVGALVRLVQPARPSHPFVLYLCDSEKDFLCVKIWHPTQHQVNAWKEKPCLVVCNLTLTNQTYRGSGSTLVTAEARSEFTTFTSSGHTSQYRGTFSEMTNMRKSRNFFQDANDRLDQRLSSSAPSTRSSSTQEEHHQQDCSEDFPPDVLEKVFGPMSQGDGFPTAGASAAGTERRQTRDLDANSDLTRGRLAGVKRGHSNDNVLQISTKRKSSSSTPDLSANNLEGKSPSTSAVCEEDDQSGESEVLKKRKRLLREKMRKLMAYDKPSPLSTLPNGGSPASGKEFKSPFPKKS